MKRLRLLLFITVLFLSIFVVAGALAADTINASPQPPVSHSTTGSPPSKSGIDNISGSYSTWDYGEYGDACTNGGTNTLCFHYHIQTNSWAFPHGLKMKLPPSWNATSGYLMDNWDCTGTGHPNELTFVGGNEPFFYEIWTMQSSDSCDAYYCMEVTTGGPENIPWYIPSDGYGGGVVDTCDNSGYYSCDEAIQPPISVPTCGAAIYLTPETQSGSGCEDETVDYTLDLFNDSGSDGTFDLSYNSVFPISGPASIFVANGASASFTVSVTVPCGGTMDTAFVTANGNGFVDSATVTTSFAPQRFIAEPGSPIPTFYNAVITYNGKLYDVAGLYGNSGYVQIWDGTSWTQGATGTAGAYAADACFGYNSNGDPVIDLFADTQSFYTLARYNINNNSWSYPPLPPGFPSNGLWQPQIVSLYNGTGLNECIITGGGTSSYGGNTNGIYAYHPDTMTVEDWGDLSYSPAGIQSHFAWYVPWVGPEGSVCVAGGTDANGITYADSQCIDLSDHTIYPPNADLGPLPAPWSDGADADGVLAGSYQIWGINGVDYNFNALNKSFYYDGTAFVYGPDTLYNVVSPEADVYNGMVWVANGNLGGYNPVTSQEALIVCDECTAAPDIAVTAPPLEATLYPDQSSTLTFVIENLGTADLAWSVADGASWLSALPESGTLAPGASVEVVVTFNSVGLTPGTYNTDLVITSDDPDEPTISLPAQLTVVQQFHHFWLPLLIKN